MAKQLALKIDQDKSTLEIFAVDAAEARWNGPIELQLWSPGSITYRYFSWDEATQVRDALSALLASQPAKQEAA